MSTRPCLQCQTPFLAKRPDHFFCSGKCVAAYYRENSNPAYIHRELPHDKPHVCEWCGVPYHVNDYAERGGKRAPKYCSPKCKQAAYRARLQGTQEQAERRYTGSNGNARSGSEKARQDSQDKQRQQSYEGHYRGRKGEYDNTRRPPVGKSKMDAQTAWRVLGVSPDAPLGAIREAYRKQAKLFHPDVNKSPDAESNMKDINAAYEYLKARKGA